MINALFIKYLLLSTKSLFVDEKIYFFDEK